MVSSLPPPIRSIMAVVNSETYSNPVDKCQVKWSYQLKAIFRAVLRSQGTQDFSPFHLSCASVSGQGTQCPPNCKYKQAYFCTQAYNSCANTQIHAVRQTLIHIHSNTHMHIGKHPCTYMHAHLVDGLM